MLLQETAVPAEPALAADIEAIDRFLLRERFHGLSLFDLALCALVLAVAWFVSRLVQAALTRAFARRAHHDQGSQTVVRRLTHYVIMTLAAFLALNVAGVELTSLFAAGAVFAVVIGFALQNLSENFVSGVILMVERSITPGDVLEVEGRVVRVVRMGIRATVARTRDDEDLIIPNSLLVTSTVKNYTLRDSIFRLRAGVGVSYESDVRQVFGVLQQAAERLDWREAAKQPVILLTGFGNSSIDFEVSVWIEDPWHARRRISQLNEAIWSSLREAGIAIAYPQLDLHLDPQALVALERRRAARE
ncbi:MAG TPA: mechanosensitive ion channel domain-containing protein [Planctomycetota bacterium]|nr:mechanosensitive ion channel domain-containing protein [Planctomycetota bacterium]